MDANISAAASSLRRAANDLQDRVRQLQTSEYNQKNTERKEESNVGRGLTDTRFELVMEQNKDQNQESRKKTAELIKHDADLRKERSQVEETSKHQINMDENEIHSLQDQIQKLNQIASTLESWRG